MQAVVEIALPGPTQASAGPTLTGFVPSAFPPGVAEFVRAERSTSELEHALETHLGKQSNGFARKQSTPSLTSADREIIVAGHRRGRPFEEVVR
jgi:hypothetical protein